MEPKGVIMPTQKYLALEMERCKDLAVQQVVEFYSETLALEDKRLHGQKLHSIKKWEKSRLENYLMSGYLY